MDGIVIINKEKGWTSNDIVRKLKGIFKEKVGHTGTLDPLATGVLPILVGKATSLSKYLINHDKEYIATIKLGMSTTTGDSEGECIEKKEVKSKMLEFEYIQEVLKIFLGPKTQIPPMYSAIKVNGKKLYEYARNGQNIDVSPRNIEIYNIELLNVLEKSQEITYKVSCSKGTYIRTLSEDIAKELGTVGFMKDLQRIKVGDFDINQALNISELEKDLNLVKSNFITVENFFENNEKVILNEKYLKLFLNGVKISTSAKDGIVSVYDENDKFIGSGVAINKRLKRDIIL